MSPAEWIRDLRLALRLLAKNPGATALAVLSIALGIGLTTGLFAVGDAAFLRPLPVEKPQELWSVTSRGDDGNFVMYGWPDYLDMAKALEGRAQFVATQRRGVQVGDGEDSQFVIIQPATPNLFQVLGVKAAMGRASLGAAEGRPETVLGYKLWQTRFASDPQIVGKTVLLNRQAFLVAGVMPEAFTGLERGILIGVWVSTDAWFHTLGNREEEQSRDGQFDIAARFRAPLSPAGAEAQLDAAIRGPGKHKPAPRGVAGTSLECLVRWKNDVIFGGGMMAVFGLILFVACANVAQLRLAQAEARRKELGVRIALGGGGWRVARQLLLETLLIGLAGAGLGLLLAQLLMEKVTQFASAMSRFMDYGIRLDYRVLAFSAGALLFALLVSGLWPALRAARLNIAEVLKQAHGVTARRRGWQQKALVISQIAVSVALFGVAVLFLSSFHNAAEIRPGLDPHKKVLALMVAPKLRIPPAAWCDQVSERLAALPGARGATYAMRLPLSGSGGGMTARVEVPGVAPMGVHLNKVGGNYFSMMGTRVVAGRGIDSQDREGAPLTVVVSQTFAHSVLVDRNALGEWVRIDGQLRQVVGIAEDGPANDVHQPPEPFVFLPYAQAMPGGDITLLVETGGEPAALDRAARAAIHGFDPGARVYDSTTLQKTLDTALSPDRFVATACSGLGLSALLLTAAGLFGVLLYAVNRRMREFGLRVALGARPLQIERLVMGESLRMAAIGVPIGLAGLAAAARLVSSMLLGVTPLDPVSYVLSAVAAMGLALAAAWLPARRATRVDPMEALRAE